MNKEILSIFKGYEETSYDTALVLFDSNRHLFIDYRELDIQEIEDFLMSQPVFKLEDKKYNYNFENGFQIGYSLPTFFSKCAERFGEKQAKILSNLFFYCRNKFNLFHFGNTSEGILHCDIIVPTQLVKDFHETFKLIFEYRNGKEDSLRMIKLSNGAIFEMNIGSFYHYLSANMFIYKTKLLADTDFEKGTVKHKVIGKWKPEIIDNLCKLKT